MRRMDPLLFPNARTRDTDASFRGKVFSLNEAITESREETGR